MLGMRPEAKESITNGRNIGELKRQCKRADLAEAAEKMQLNVVSQRATWFKVSAKRAESCQRVVCA